MPAGTDGMEYVTSPVPPVVAVANEWATFKTGPASGTALSATIAPDAAEAVPPTAAFDLDVLFSGFAPAYVDPRMATQARATMVEIMTMRVRMKPPFACGLGCGTNGQPAFEGAPSGLGP